MTENLMIGNNLKWTKSIQFKHIFLSHNAINFGAKWVFIFSHFNILHFVTKYFTGGDLQQKSEISNGRMATSPD